MKYAIAIILTAYIGFTSAQALYDANGQYRGYSQTSSSGIATTYNSQGQSIGASQIDNGQTSYYSPSGAYQGTNTATPATLQPNTN